MPHNGFSGSVDMYRREGFEFVARLIKKHGADAQARFALVVRRTTAVKEKSANLYGFPARGSHNRDFANNVKPAGDKPLPVSLIRLSFSS